MKLTKSNYFMGSASDYYNYKYLRTLDGRKTFNVVYGQQNQTSLEPWKNDWTAITRKRNVRKKDISFGQITKVQIIEQVKDKLLIFDDTSGKVVLVWS